MIILICVAVILFIAAIVAMIKEWHSIIYFAFSVIALFTLVASLNVNTGPYKPVTLNIEVADGVMEEVENKYYKYEDEYYIIEEDQEKEFFWIPFYEVEMEKVEFKNVVYEGKLSQNKS